MAHNKPATMSHYYVDILRQAGYIIRYKRGHKADSQTDKREIIMDYVDTTEWMADDLEALAEVQS